MKKITLSENELMGLISKIINEERKSNIMSSEEYNQIVNDYEKNKEISRIQYARLYYTKNLGKFKKQTNYNPKYSFELIVDFFNKHKAITPGQKTWIFYNKLSNKFIEETGHNPNRTFFNGLNDDERIEKIFDFYVEHSFIPSGEYVWLYNHNLLETFNELIENNPKNVGERFKNILKNNDSVKDLSFDDYNFLATKHLMDHFKNYINEKKIEKTGNKRYDEIISYAPNVKYLSRRDFDWLFDNNLLTKFKQDTQPQPQIKPKVKQSSKPKVKQSSEPKEKQLTYTPTQTSTSTSDVIGPFNYTYKSKNTK
jgi:hypothetical protein